jgi:response regulator RpfG family c-di-GMP phosphodiesterase
MSSPASTDQLEPTAAAAAQRRTWPLGLVAVLAVLAVAGGIGFALRRTEWAWPAATLLAAAVSGGLVHLLVRRQRRIASETLAQWQCERDAAWRREQVEFMATQRDLIATLSGVVESRSFETANHTERVGHGAALLASLAGVDLLEAELLRLAAPMHDLGKIAIDDHVLKKAGKLDPAEYEVMKTHTAIGSELLSRLKRPVLEVAAVVALEHHEKWDGTGYPRGLCGEEISVYGRIVAIVDVFDALTSNRVYRKAMDLEDALGILRQGRGTHFDPTLLDTFITYVDRFTLLTQTYADPVTEQTGPQDVPESDPACPLLAGSVALAPSLN